MLSLELDAAVVAAHLVAGVRIGETDPVAQEVQLHVPAELGEWHELPLNALLSISHVPAETVTGSQREYVDFLRQIG
jgi:hypothetical protein